MASEDVPTRRRRADDRSERCASLLAKRLDSQPAMPANGSGPVSQVSRARGPKPEGPLVHSNESLGESPVEAMSRWAHGTSPAKCWRNSAAVIAPGPLGALVASATVELRGSS